MIKTFAAIWYQQEQNEPSLPFVLKLDVADDTKESLEIALVLYAEESEEQGCGGWRVSERSFFGDECYQIESDNSSLYLFATPEDRC
jgi:hypothetical protein